MYRPRIIPVLLLKGTTLVKSIQFKDYTYIGDPINAVKIFNDLKADELIFLDILASTEERTISLNLTKDIAEEANMPFSVGGGINSLEQIRNILMIGAERVIIGAKACKTPRFIKEASDEFGASTISVCIDVKRNFWGKEIVWYKNGRHSTNYLPEEFARLIEDMGAGEVVIQAISKDGTMTGYDIELIHRISVSVSIPVVALGGAGGINDLKEAYFKGNANGLAGGSMFVYQGKKRGILINYPTKEEITFMK